jgi:outer membrane protein assembly factor BamB
MAGTGIPAGVDPNCPAGCVDSRVSLVDPSGNIAWQYGQFGVNGSGPDQLNAPVQATWAPDKTVYITDQGNQRVIQVDQNLNIVWQYGTTGVSGNGFDQLNNPNSAELLKNGDVLIADESNNRVIEVNKTTLNVVATYTAQGTMNGPAFASLLPNHTLLVTDGGNNRIITLDQGDNVLFQYFTNTEVGSNPNPIPTRAVRARGTKTLISDQFNNRVIIIDKKGNLLAQYGNLNTIGYGTTNTQQGLYAPYDAKVIGDYTGLTRP